MTDNIINITVGLIILMIIICILSPFIWILRFQKNKSKLKININKNNLINFGEKYPDLKNEHNNLYNKKTNTNKRDLYKKYNDILLKDIIHNTFNIISNNTIKLTEKSSLEELNIFENYQENQDNIIKNVMKKTKKKYYKNFEIRYDLYCELNNKTFNIKNIRNYKTVRTPNSDGPVGHADIYSFSGYLITIPDFTKEEHLTFLHKNDYFYNKENNTLYLMISDECNNLFMAVADNFDIPNIYKSFDKDNYLGKKYNHYTELRNIILKLL